MADEKGGMIKVCGLWLNESKNGKYFSGTLGGIKILIFKNQYKKEDKHPDYNLFFAPKEDKRGGGSSGGDNSNSGSDDVPF